MKKRAVFPGSFDPYTKGHQDIVIRGLKLFDEIIIGIGYNTAKHKRYFDIDFMVKKIDELYKDDDRIKVEVYNELTAIFALLPGSLAAPFISTSPSLISGTSVLKRFIMKFG